MRGAAAAADAIRRLDIGGSIGIDLPTAGSKAARQRRRGAIDANLPQPFERTAVNGFGFVQIVRPRRAPSLVELAQDRAAFEARALLRRAASKRQARSGSSLIPAVIAVLDSHAEWIERSRGRSAARSSCGGRSAPHVGRLCRKPLTSQEMPAVRQARSIPTTRHSAAAAARTATS